MGMTLLFHKNMTYVLRLFVARMNELIFVIARSLIVGINDSMGIDADGNRRFTRVRHAHDSSRDERSAWEFRQTQHTPNKL